MKKILIYDFEGLKYYENIWSDLRIYFWLYLINIKNKNILENLINLDEIDRFKIKEAFL